MLGLTEASPLPAPVRGVGIGCDVLDPGDPRPTNPPATGREGIGLPGTGPGDRNLAPPRPIPGPRAGDSRSRPSEKADRRPGTNKEWVRRVPIGGSPVAWGGARWRGDLQLSYQLTCTSA
jgi:hypothetical protein